jgi:hypothetical protein
MSYAAFIGAIKEPALIDVVTHWNEARGSRRLPAWRDLDATVLGRRLPIIWAWHYDAALDSFIGRLAGEEIVAVLGRSIRGRRIETCFPSEAVPLILARYRRVVHDPCFMRGHGRVFAPVGGSGIGERVVLPLGDDGLHADGILGATVYRLPVRPDSRQRLAIDHHNEQVEFFSFETATP